MGYTRGEFMQMGLAGLLASGEVAAQEQTRQPSYLCVYRPGPRWLPGKPLAEQPLREHGRYMLDLYKRGASKNLGVLWDTLHSYRHGETAVQSWSALGDRIKLVHVKDAYKATPTAFDFALTGEGTVPIMSFVDVLRRNNYNGYVNFEWEKGWHREIAEPEVAIPHFAKFMAARL